MLNKKQPIFTLSCIMYRNTTMSKYTQEQQEAPALKEDITL